MASRSRSSGLQRVDAVGGRQLGVGVRPRLPREGPSTLFEGISASHIPAPYRPCRPADSHVVEARPAAIGYARAAMDDPADAAMHAYYALGGEQDRLSEGDGVVEFERTKEILLRHPPTPAVVADIGGGPGRYALWLAGRGHRVEHRDLVALHVDQLRAAAAGLPQVRTAVGDARELDLADASVDAVLLLGPLYHLRRRRDRVRALAEAGRVVRPGGPVFVAAISRWAPSWTRLRPERPRRAHGRSGWAAPCSTPPGPSNACPSCSGSARICWRPPGHPGLNGRRAPGSGVDRGPLVGGDLGVEDPVLGDGGPARR